MSSAEVQRHASLSACGKYRFELGRAWDSELPRLVFVMLNPSTADAEQDDPTIRKCIGFARRLGFGSISVANLFAYRATKPAALKAAGYPLHAYEDYYISKLSAGGDSDSSVVCAWGSNATGLARVAEVLALIRKAGRKPLALRVNGDGTPAHPLMLPYSCALSEMPA